MVSRHRHGTSELAAHGKARHRAPALLRVVRRVDHTGNLVVLTVAGDVDLSTLPVLEHHLAAAAPQNMIVDLDQVGFFSVAGVSALIRASGHARAARRHFAVVASNCPAARVLSLTRAEQSFAVFATVPDAISQLS
ncbi:STAS domain-containing protein [Amycolatopsis echigonensis]|uniref:Anti-anti-sigma factor n=1 Tax=Amycolatopsis echigonensis TaxID=2576905 RepID=A0A2N3X1P9_9PSEU|nr:MULTISPECIES: STAS domain-containing protein [Amycolatopsis]MBB2500528.1 STAS domain-containing protein [Amycolatopsis echigonensis]PKW00039.1 anti-anti-sigma factor [Amycolatopsis niigatensis]